METVLALLPICIMVAGAWFIWFQTKTKGRFGLGRVVSNCPRCGASLSFFRVPRSLREGLFGGYTCPKCGCKLDKYGRELAAK